MRAPGGSPVTASRRLTPAGRAIHNRQSGFPQLPFLLGSAMALGGAAIVPCLRRVIHKMPKIQRSHSVFYASPHALACKAGEDGAEGALDSPFLAKNYTYPPHVYEEDGLMDHAAG